MLSKISWTEKEILNVEYFLKKNVITENKLVVSRGRGLVCGVGVEWGETGIWVKMVKVIKSYKLPVR